MNANVPLARMHLETIESLGVGLVGDGKGNETQRAVSLSVGMMLRGVRKALAALDDTETTDNGGR